VILIVDGVQPAVGHKLGIYVEIRIRQTEMKFFERIMLNGNSRIDDLATQFLLIRKGHAESEYTDASPQYPFVRERLATR